MYIGNAIRFTLRYSYSHHASIGHLVKSRARENRILYNRIMDEADGTSSYVIDLPNGGLSYVIEPPAKRTQRRQFDDVIYGEEGLTNPDHGLYIVNNTFVNNSVGHVGGRGGSTATVRTICSSYGTLVSGGGPATPNLESETSAPNFVNIGAFDYRPTATTPG